jgi:hypothetical protein
MPLTNCFPIAPVPITDDVVGNHVFEGSEIQQKTIHCAHQLEADCGIDIQLSGYVVRKAPEDAQLLLTLERVRQVRQAWVDGGRIEPSVIAPRETAAV